MTVHFPEGEQIVVCNFWVCNLLSTRKAHTALYGIDWDGPLSSDGDASVVSVPETCSPLRPADYAQLCALVDPQMNSDDQGIDQYLTAIRFVQSTVRHYNIS